MADERQGGSEYSALSGFIDLITLNAEHFRAYTAFFVVTTYESMAASGDLTNFFKVVAKARRKLLIEQDLELLDAYREIEVAFNALGVDLKDARDVLNKIRSDERVRRMREFDSDFGGIEPNPN